MEFGSGEYIQSPPPPLELESDAEMNTTARRAKTKETGSFRRAICVFPRIRPVPSDSGANKKGSCHLLVGERRGGRIDLRCVG